MTIMTSNDLHEIIFIWPRTDAKRVVVTGTFDNWAKSLQLARTTTGFSASVRVPWNSTVAYKYLVDGKWALDETKPRIIEPEGYVNNVYVVPSRPSRAATESAGATAGDAIVQDKVSNLNGHATLDKMQQLGFPSQPADDSSIAQAVMSVPVDRKHIAGESNLADQDVASKAVEKTVEEKPEGSASNPASLPNGHSVETSAQGTVEEPGAQIAGATTKAGEEMSQTTSPSSGDSKRPIQLPFVPVNVPSEGMGNGHSQNGDETASTHKPLGLLNKPTHSPSAASESIPVTSNVPREPEQPESKVPAASDTPPVESSAQEGAISSGEPGIEEGKDVAPASSGEEPKAPAPPQEAVPSKEELAVPQASDAGKATQPTREEKPPQSATLPKAGGRTSLVRSFTGSGSGKTYFPRVSRESSDSRKSLPNEPRKKKTTLLQKIKQVFTHHDKEKK